MPGFLHSPRFLRRLLWVTGLVLVAAAVALPIAFFGSSVDPIEDEVQPGPAVETQAAAQRPVPVAREARVVAGQFILWAVATGRKPRELAKAWELLHPTLKADCACTKKEWLTGNIPIQPYPIDQLETASFAVDESFANRVVLQIALLPKDGADIAGQIFYIGLRAVGRGEQKRWLVDYWAPFPILEVNRLPEGG